jgi:ribosomal-protein-serine acetyltransferase
VFPGSVTAIPPQTLRGAAVLLHPWQADDEGPLYEAARESLSTVGRWLPWLDDSYAPSDSKAWIDASADAWRSGHEYRFAIFDAGPGGRLLGGTGLNQLNHPHRVANLGYWVRDTAVGRGIATEAARLASQFALTTLGCSRVEILTIDGNVASQRVAEKLGAAFEGVLRDRLWLRGKVYPARLYSIVRGDLSK